MVQNVLVSRAQHQVLEPHGPLHSLQRVSYYRMLFLFVYLFGWFFETGFLCVALPIL